MLKGSYTLEAAIMVSLYLFAAAAAMQIGIDLYQEISETPAAYAEDIDVTMDFYKAVMVRKLEEQAKGVYEEWKDQ